MSKGRDKKANYQESKEIGRRKRNNNDAKKPIKKKPSRNSPSSSEGSEQDTYTMIESFLNPLNLMLLDVLGDGNCLFRSLSDQLYGNVEQHREVRKETCDYLLENSKEFELFFSEEETFGDHLTRMRNEGTFGGNVELVAFARKFKVKVNIYQEDGNVMRIDFDNKDNNNMEEIKTLHIAYHSWEHYSSIRNKNGPFEGLPNIKIKTLNNDNEGESELNEIPETNQEFENLKENNCNDEECKQEITKKSERKPMKHYTKKGTLNKRILNQIDKIKVSTGFKDDDIILKLLEEHKNNGRKVIQHIKKNKLLENKVDSNTVTEATEQTNENVERNMDEGVKDNKNEDVKSNTNEAVKDDVNESKEIGNDELIDVNNGNININMDKYINKLKQLTLENTQNNNNQTDLSSDIQIDNNNDNTQTNKLEENIDIDIDIDSKIEDTIVKEKVAGTDNKLINAKKTKRNKKEDKSILKARKRKEKQCEKIDNSKGVLKKEEEKSNSLKFIDI
ncbi:cysteine proteinase [Neoconidiobolus thromboides FSU 785]|nr:cysteine proteinase [Neoconidiobolus thromboides FSU 785]